MAADTPLADTLLRLRPDAPGRALYARESVNDGHWETVWVIYDESRCLYRAQRRARLALNTLA